MAIKRFYVCCHRRDYSRVLHLSPNYISAYVNLAYTYQYEGKYMRAWKAFSTALAIDKRCSLALEGRAIIHHLMSNYSGAIADIQEAIASPTMRVSCIESNCFQRNSSLNILNTTLIKALFPRLAKILLLH